MSDEREYQESTRFLAPRAPVAAALVAFLEGLSQNTRRSYSTALRQFLSSLGEDPERSLPQLTALQIVTWKRQLKDGHTTATVAARLSAAAAFLRYLHRAGILNTNPMDLVERGDLKVSAYERARTLSVEEFHRILAAIDNTTVKGLRDRALLLFFTLTAARRGEVLSLTGGDLRREEGRVYYLSPVKGGGSRRRELPPPAAEALFAYLESCGRAPRERDPLFLPTVPRQGAVAARRASGADPRGLSGEAVRQMLRGYARRAGVRPPPTIHSLRHLGARLYHAASGDLEETRAFLGHRNLSTTGVYLRQVAGEEHRRWEAMWDRIK